MLFLFSSLFVELRSIPQRKGRRIRSHDLLLNRPFSVGINDSCLDTSLILISEL